MSYHEASSRLGLRHGPTCFAWGICSQKGYGVPMCIAPSATRTQGLAGVQMTVSVWPCIPACPCVGTPHTLPAQTLLLQGAKSLGQGGP